VVLMAAFGVLGYVFRKLDCEPAPLMLGLVLGPLLEENFRRAMVLSDGDATVFLTRPISLAFLIAAVALLAAVLMPSIRRGRQVAFRE
jgi:putative tricarboxylic transport membrane protein